MNNLRKFILEYEDLNDIRQLKDEIPGVARGIGKVAKGVGKVVAAPIKVGAHMAQNYRAKSLATKEFKPQILNRSAEILNQRREAGQNWAAAKQGE